MKAVTVKVMRREFEKGKKRIYDFEFGAQVELEVPTKLALFNACKREFGRCAGLIPMGWRFERIERFDDGSQRWVEYHVSVVKGAVPSDGFTLED